MKNIVNSYKSLPLHERVLYVVCAAALVVLALVVSTEKGACPVRQRVRPAAGPVGRRHL